MTFTPNPYPSLDDAQYEAVVNGRYVKSSFSNGNAGCLSFTVAGGLIGFQDDKLPPAERKARTLIFDRHEMAAFIGGAKNGDFDHLLDTPSPGRSSPCQSAWGDSRQGHHVDDTEGVG